MRSGCTGLPDIKDTQLRSSDQESFPSAAKNTWVILVPLCKWKCVPTTISDAVDISEVPECNLLIQMSSEWRSQKLFQGLMSHELAAYLPVFIFNSLKWPYYQKDGNEL